MESLQDVEAAGLAGWLDKCPLGEAELHFPEFPSLHVSHQSGHRRYSCGRSEGEKQSNGPLLPLIFWLTLLAPNRCILLLLLPPQSSPVWKQLLLPPHLPAPIPNSLATISWILSWQPNKPTPFQSADLPPLPGKMPAFSQGLWGTGLLRKERMGAELVGTRPGW